MHDASGQLTTWPGHRSIVQWDAIASCYIKIYLWREDYIWMWSSYDRIFSSFHWYISYIKNKFNNLACLILTPKPLNVHLYNQSEMGIICASAGMGGEYNLLASYFDFISRDFLHVTNIYLPVVYYWINLRVEWMERKQYTSIHLMYHTMNTNILPYIV